MNRSTSREHYGYAVYRDRATAELQPTSTQIGFTQVALLKVLQTAEHPERQAWIDQYKAMTTAVDHALFMSEARLKVQHGIDLKRFERVDNPDRPRSKARENP